jgi:hypothetical protein
MQAVLRQVLPAGYHKHKADKRRISDRQKDRILQLPYDNKEGKRIYDKRQDQVQQEDHFGQSTGA